MKAKFIGEDYDVLTNYGYTYSITEGGWVSNNLATVVYQNRCPYEGQIMQYTPGRNEVHARNITTLVTAGLAKWKDKPSLTGVELIAQERKRQIEVEGFSAEHDDELINGELSDAAACYALSPEYLVMTFDGGGSFLHNVWPFNMEWYKQTTGDRKIDLVKAGALIAAELDRLIRMEEKL
ncbi:hypothetical protein [Treponema sp. R6D11]